MSDRRVANDIIVFISAHFTTENFKYIKPLLASIDEQQYSKVDCVILTFSCEPSLKISHGMFGKYEQFQLELNYRPIKQTQFEHYRDGVKMAEKYPDDTLVLFSDADDLWHSHRLVTFLNTFCNARTVHLWRCVFHCELTGNLRDTNDTSAIDAAVVDTKSDVNVVVGGSGDIGEYWNSMTTLHAVRSFMDDANEHILHHPYCDYAFQNYLNRYACARGLKQIMYMMPVKGWNYAQRIRDDSVCGTLQAEFKRMAIPTSVVPDAVVREVRDVLEGEMGPKSALCVVERILYADLRAILVSLTLLFFVTSAKFCKDIDTTLVQVFFPVSSCPTRKITLMYKNLTLIANYIRPVIWRYYGKALSKVTF